MKKRVSLPSAEAAQERYTEIWKEGDTPLLSLDAYYLKFSDDSKNPALVRIDKYHEHCNRKLSRYCEKKLLPRVIADFKTAAELGEPFYEVKVKSAAKLTYNDDYIASIINDITETSERAGRTARFSGVWSLITGCPLPLSSFYGKNVNFKKRAVTHIVSEIERISERGFADFHENPRKSVRKHFSSENYYLNPDGISLYFQSGTIAPRREGIRVFTIPWNESGPVEPCLYL